MSAGRENDWELDFEYYKQQRGEMHQLGQERLSTSLQLLVFAAGLVASYVQDEMAPIRSWLAGFVVIIGALGLCLNVRIEGALRAHMERARSARRRIASIETLATGDFPRTHWLYYSFHGLIVVLGLALFCLAKR
ncbi:MAG: hypothetical protein KDA27_19005 [Candidatus Eisenbacteria bacterium]|uniref:Uncharacterized protein n=1 Tax=Eiseniibacteriota bacterium TaxID=2212470 RepID=A0A956NEY7_UNCEI|nr:hypothetical protein [Candidatus Eisenbacteria bacterium]